jgi:tetratricopeptide (TPR) repeat protein/predicted aspartyl protease
VKLVRDSGAFNSTLTDAAAAQLSLRTTKLPFGVLLRGVTGEMKARKTVVKRLGIANGELENIEFIVGGNEPGAGARGLLGRNLLGITDAEFDVGHGAVRLMFPEGDCRDKSVAYWADSTPVYEVALLSERGDEAPAIRSLASLNGTIIQVLFDTGAASSVVSLAAAQRAGVTREQLEPAGQIRGAGRGEATAWTASFGSFEIGGERVTNTRMFVADFDGKKDDMIVGVDFFLTHRIYVSKSERTIYFTRNPEADAAPNNGVASGASAHSQTERADAPADAAGYARRGAAAAARGDNTRALADLNRACALEPTAASHFTLRGLVQLDLEQPDKALEDFEQALRLDPATYEARFYRARLRAASGDRDGAIEDLRIVDEALAPQDHMRLNMSRVYQRLDRYDESLNQLNQWIAAHPNDVTLPSARNERCWARAMLNIELDQALADCNAAVKQKPGVGAFLGSRALVRLRQGRWRDAVADYDGALRDQPKQVWSLYGRGIARIHQGEREQGLADVEAARQLRPSIDEEAARRGIRVP